MMRNWVICDFVCLKCEVACCCYLFRKVSMPWFGINNSRNRKQQDNIQYKHNRHKQNQNNTTVSRNQSQIKQQQQQISYKFIIITTITSAQISKNQLTPMLSFSDQNVTFEYNNNTHLATKIEIKNNSLMYVYYKFKVNRPRYYLVKPDRGLIQPNQTVEIHIKLHREGIAQANTDKFKCFYVQSNAQANDKDMQKFQERLGTEQKKLMVIVSNIPAGIQSVKVIPPMGSQLKSLANTRTNLISSQRGSTQYQSIIQQKRDRVTSLTNEIERIEKQNKFVSNNAISSSNKKKSSSWVSVIGVGIFGVVLGIFSSLWI